MKNLNSSAPLSTANPITSDREASNAISSAVRQNPIHNGDENASINSRETRTQTPPPSYDDPNFKLAKDLIHPDDEFGFPSTPNEERFGFSEDESPEPAPATHSTEPANPLNPTTINRSHTT